MGWVWVQESHLTQNHLQEVYRWDECEYRNHTSHRTIYRKCTDGMSVSTGITPHTEPSAGGVKMGWMWVQKLCLTYYTTQWRIQDLAEGINLLFGQMFLENCMKLKEFRSATTTIFAGTIINQHISYRYSYSNQWSSIWLHKTLTDTPPVLLGDPWLMDDQASGELWSKPWVLLGGRTVQENTNLFPVWQ